MEDVLPLRGEQTPRIDPATLPDPRPVVAAELRDLIDRCEMSWDEIAAHINRLCGEEHLDRFAIERWHQGEGRPPRWHHVRVLEWLAGEPVRTFTPRLAPS